MDREIKFRAWSPSSKRMYKPWNLEWLKDNNSDAPEDFLKVYLWDDDLIFMQYTGLKDKNGKGIYEGDIIEVEQMQGMGKFIGVVHFGADPARPYDYRCWMDTTHSEATKKHGLGSKWCCIHNNPKVIGNIYQNPELLKS